MEQFSQDDLTRFLASLDSHLTKPRCIVLIGGAAASLGYGISRTTTDIDTLESTADLKEAIRLARAELEASVERRRVLDG